MEVTCVTMFFLSVIISVVRTELQSKRQMYTLTAHEVSTGMKTSGSSGLWVPTGYWGIYVNVVIWGSGSLTQDVVVW